MLLRPPFENLTLSKRAIAGVSLAAGTLLGQSWESVATMCSFASAALLELEILRLSYRLLHICLGSLEKYFLDFSRFNIRKAF